jgi:hypothetical protein
MVWLFVFFCFSDSFLRWELRDIGDRLIFELKNPTQAIVYAALKRYKRKEVAKEDILDSMAAVIVACSPVSSLTTVPVIPDKDAKGVRGCPWKSFFPNRLFGSNTINIFSWPLELVVLRREVIFMCELLGLCFNTEVSVQLAFSGLKAGAMENPDGWGVGWYDEYGTQIIKESRPADRSRLAEDFRKHLGARSRIFVSHIRHATAGKVGYVNTHPFYQRFDQKTWIFAHNGTIDSSQLSFFSKEFSPIGETDSELVFCSLLSWLSHRDIQLSGRVIDWCQTINLLKKYSDILRQAQINPPRR